MLALIAIDLDNRLRKGVRRLLRHVVADAAQDLVRVFAGELLGVRSSVRGRAIEVARNRDSGHRDDRSVRQLLL